MVMSGRSVNLTTLFLGRLRPPKRLTSTSCTLMVELFPRKEYLLTLKCTIIYGVVGWGDGAG